jgi:hypothetical protein
MPLYNVHTETSREEVEEVAKTLVGVLRERADVNL